MRRAQVLLAMMLAAAFCNCGDSKETAASDDGDLEVLLQLHDHQRKAHFERDADLFVAMFADPLLMVKNGEVRKVDREESRRANQAYFAGSTFLEWDDVEPPVIHVADDGTMAWCLIQKRVRLLSDDDGDGVEEEERTIFAWMEAWEKVDGQWRLVAVTSTERPRISSAPGQEVPVQEERDEGHGEQDD